VVYVFTQVGPSTATWAQGHLSSSMGPFGMDLQHLMGTGECTNAHAEKYTHMYLCTHIHTPAALHGQNAYAENTRMYLCTHMHTPAAPHGHSEDTNA